MSFPVHPNTSNDSTASQATPKKSPVKIFATAADAVQVSSIIVAAAAEATLPSPLLRPCQANLIVYPCNHCQGPVGLGLFRPSADRLGLFPLPPAAPCRLDRYYHSGRYKLNRNILRTVSEKRSRPTVLQWCIGAAPLQHHMFMFQRPVLALNKVITVTLKLTTLIAHCVEGKATCNVASLS
ncbi:hypothetical protein J6590_024174 [Homalodisca vitripennis]|nr:hypothetical protein J6590_024174 [Homalodisca vitripennis]